MDSEVEQSVGMASRMVGAIGLRHSAGNVRIDKGLCKWLCK